MAAVTEIRTLRERVAEFPPERVAAITGVPAETIVALARRYATARPALLKTADEVAEPKNRRVEISIR